MPSLLEQAVIDAKLLKEAAIKNAENIIKEKYASELKETLDKILEQEEEDILNPDGGSLSDLGSGMPPTEDPMAKNIPMAATNGEKTCPCPDDDQEIEINFDQLSQNMNGSASQQNQPPGQMGELPTEDDMPMLEDASAQQIQVPAQLGPDLHKYHLNMGDAIYQVGSLAYSGKPASPDLIKSAISSLESMDSKVTDEQEKNQIQALKSQLEQLVSTHEIGQEEKDKVEPTSVPSMTEGDYDQNLYENENMDLSEDILESILETLEVDIKNVPIGHAGRATSEEREHAVQVELARSQDTKVAEEQKALKKAMDKLAESERKLKTLSEQNKSLVLENNKIKSTAQQIADKLKETNLENAKLVYQNRALKSNSLNERQKNSIVEAISKVGSVNEAKIVFESSTVSSNRTETKKHESINESLNFNKGNLLTIIKPTNTVLTENFDPTKERMQRLAGIKKN